jgi:HEAT repeat protein
VTLLGILFVMAVAQSIFLVLLAVALYVNRGRSRVRRARADAAAELIAAPLREWLITGGAPTALLVAMRSLDPDDAAVALLRVASSRVPSEQAVQLAAAMREEPWVERTLQRATSPFWWRRMTAARLMAMAGVARDVPALRQLLRDPNDAVQVIAGAALERIADKDAIDEVLDRLPARPQFVQLFLFSILKSQWAVTSPQLRDRLGVETDIKRLRCWVAFADVLATPELLEGLCALGTHADIEVRLGVAKALRNYYHPMTATVLTALLSDVDARVRTRAAQSLGSMGAAEAVGQLVSKLNDPDWNVRFRSSVALAQLGDRGREALLQLRESPDKYASQMASMITGLSPGAVTEIAEG